MSEDDQKLSEHMDRGEERLAKFLAHAGIASRRHAEELIAAGHVSVNGTVVTTQGVRIDPKRDRVCVDGKVVAASSGSVYVLLHKPAGYVCTVHDPQGRPIVLDLLPPHVRQMRVYPVGRLDLETSGLLLLTNDGQFAQHLAHPRYSMEKRYHVLVEGYPSGTVLDKLRRGVEIMEDNGCPHKTAPARVQVVRCEQSGTWLMLAIHEGRKRQIRRMLNAVGYHVVQLIRVGIGPLTLEGLPVGRWRYLHGDEIAKLLG